MKYLNMALYTCLYAYTPANCKLIAMENGLFRDVCPIEHSDFHGNAGGKKKGVSVSHV